MLVRITGKTAVRSAPIEPETENNSTASLKTAGKFQASGELPKMIGSKMTRATALMWLVVTANVVPVMAQNGSLFQRPLPQVVSATQVDPRTAMNMAPSTMETGTIVAPSTPAYPQLAAASWTYAVPSPPRVIRVHDVISIRIDEVARATAEGRATQRKNALYDAVLKDWLEFDGLGVRKGRPSQR